MLPFLTVPPAMMAMAQTPADAFSAAVAGLAHRLKAEPGAGAVLQAERLDAHTVRLRVKCLGAGFKEITATSPEAPNGAYAIAASTPQMMDSFETTAVMPAEALTLKVKLSGEMFNPSLLIPITKAGQQAEPQLIQMGLRSK